VRAVRPSYGLAKAGQKHAGRGLKNGDELTGSSSRSRTRPLVVLIMLEVYPKSGWRGRDARRTHTPRPARQRTSPGPNPFLRVAGGGKVSCDHIGPQGKVETMSGLRQSFEKPLPRSIPVQQRQTAEARKGEIVSVSRLVVAFDSLSMARSHADGPWSNMLSRPILFGSRACTHRGPRKHGTRRIHRLFHSIALVSYTHAHARRSVLSFPRLLWRPRFLFAQTGERQLGFLSEPGFLQSFREFLQVTACLASADVLQHLDAANRL
jgi:hypothetical protein